MTYHHYSFPQNETLVKFNQSTELFIINTQYIHPDMDRLKEI